MKRSETTVAVGTQVIPKPPRDAKLRSLEREVGGGEGGGGGIVSLRLRCMMRCCREEGGNDLSLRRRLNALPSVITDLSQKEAPDTQKSACKSERNIRKKRVDSEPKNGREGGNAHVSASAHRANSLASSTSMTTFLTHASDRNPAGQLKSPTIRQRRRH